MQPNVPFEPGITPGISLNIATGASISERSQFAKFDSLTKDEPDFRKGVSLKNPVFGTVEFLPRTYPDADGNVLSTPDLVLETVFVSISQSKNIVTTAIEGRNGTIKEFVSKGDFIINISGQLVGKNGIRPKEEINALREICAANIELSVINTALKEWGIEYLVITGFDIPQNPGGWSVQPFNINAISDTAFYFES